MGWGAPGPGGGAGTVSWLRPSALVRQPGSAGASSGCRGPLCAPFLETAGPALGSAGGAGGGAEGGRAHPANRAWWAACGAPSTEHRRAACRTKSELFTEAWGADLRPASFSPPSHGLSVSSTRIAGWEGGQRGRPALLEPRGHPEPGPSFREGAVPGVRGAPPRCVRLGPEQARPRGLPASQCAG